MKHRRKIPGPIAARLNPEEHLRRQVAASFRHSPQRQRAAARSSQPFRWSDAPYADDTAIGLGGPVIPPQSRAPREGAFDEVEPPSLRPTGDLGDRIRALEARLDSMLDGGAHEDAAGGPSRVPPPPEDPGDFGDAIGNDVISSPPLELEDELGDDPLAEDATDAEAGSADEGDAAPSTDASPAVPLDPRDPARRSRFFKQKWGRKAGRRRAAEVDEFGLDPVFDRRFAEPLLAFLFQNYFRGTVTGIEHVPAEGRCLIVANHSGTLPVDGPMLRTAIRLMHPSRRDVRWLSEDFLYYLPFAGTFITRTGAVRACTENAARLLDSDRCVIAFPEGVAGIRKLYRDRYRLQRFGRGGFVRLALRAGAPIVPCAIVGAEETGPMLLRDELIARWIGLPYLPITPTFPWLGPLGLLPAPTRWSIRFGEPLTLDEYGPGAVDDDLLVARLGDHVRNTIQQMLDEGVRKRRSVWFG